MKYGTILDHKAQNGTPRKEIPGALPEYISLLKGMISAEL
jgi:hypothetical protein